MGLESEPGSQWKLTVSQDEENQVFKGKQAHLLRQPFSFLHFFFLGTVLTMSLVQCHGLLCIVHQALCLSDIIP